MRRAEHATKDERAEAGDTARARLGELLGDSMSQHAVQCVLLGDGAGKPRYVRGAAAPRPYKLATPDDALELVRDVAREVEHVPAERLPAAVAKIVRERARWRGRSPARAATLSVVATRRPRATPSWTSRPRRPTRHAGRAVRRRLRRARARRAGAQAAARGEAACRRGLAEAMQAPATVQMQDGSGLTRVVRVEPVAAPSRPAKLGIRMLLPLVREAAAEAAKERHRDLTSCCARTSRSGCATRPPKRRPPPSGSRWSSTARRPRRRVRDALASPFRHFYLVSRDTRRP